jgi:hypothetical protein
MTTIISNKDTLWLCLRHPEKDIFYWVHSKCASSFYRKILTDLSWKACTTHDIVWGQSTVFSHIRDPLQKHRTGLIEYFYFHRCVEILTRNWDDENFWLMLARTAWLDIHSMSIWQHLEEKSELIHWIPTDVKWQNHIDSTLDFIEFTGDKSKILYSPEKNVSSGFKKECVSRLLEIDPDPLIIKYLEKDRVLYDKVSCKPGFEPQEYQQNLEKLLSQGHDRLQAEYILDQQVASGEYLRWKSGDID